MTKLHARKIDFLHNAMIFPIVFEKKLLQLKIATIDDSLIYYFKPFSWNPFVIIFFSCLIFNEEDVRSNRGTFVLLNISQFMEIILNFSPHIFLNI